MIVSKDKRYSIRNGTSVTILSISTEKTSYPVLGSVFSQHKPLEAWWTIDGYFLGKEMPHPLDLIEVKNA
jgi:hypothetical protein